MKNIFSPILLLLLFISCSQLSYAGNELKTQSIDLTGSIPSSSTVKSDKFDIITQLNNDFWIEKTSGNIFLKCDAKNFSNTTPTSVNVTFNVSYYTLTSPTVIQTESNIKLTLKYDKGILTSTVYHHISDAINVTISNIRISGNSTNFPSLKLENTITTQSYQLKLTGPSINTIYFEGNTHSSSDQTLIKAGDLPVYWNPIVGAESYELEWTYVSDQSATVGIRDLPAEVQIDPLLFENNSSRVELSSSTLSFNIPLVYEKGIILFRIRATGKGYKDNTAYIFKTEWSVNPKTASTANNYNYFVYDGLENNLNWQSSISFAEEGKTKTVVNYFDGSMRSRQVKTRINSDERSIVGETFYDFNGRPVIQLLPVPVPNKELSFVPDFNIIEGTSHVSKTDYVIEEADNTCAVTAPQFSTSTGASRYYSVKNKEDFTSNGTNTKNDIINQDLIPDAQKYPYTQTRYTPDNTGRVEKQSGVGPDHTLTGQHATTNLYGNPENEEITRLFGSDIGQKSHYQKNVVIDANGQASTSYLDLDGKVVATALAGTNTTNLTSLDGNKTKDIESDLLVNTTSNIRSDADYTITYSSKLTVTSNNIPYKFSYEGYVKPIEIGCDGLGVNKIVYDGPVKVNINLQDNCKVVKLNENLASNTALKSLSDQKLTMADKTVALDKGEWNISKTYSIDKKTLDTYWDDYLAKKPNCLKTLQAFIDSAELAIAPGRCNISCDECDAKLNSPNLDPEDRELFINLCDRVCNRLSACQNELEAMAADFHPDGQYGELRKGASNLNKAASSVKKDDIKQSSKEKTLDKIEANINQATVSSTDSKNGSISDNDSKITPELFPLSIFNTTSNNQLKNHIKSTNIPSDAANWKNPMVPVITPSEVLSKGKLINYYRNLSPKSEDLLFKDKKEAQYLNIDGSVSKINALFNITTTGTTTTITSSPEIDLNAFLADYPAEAANIPQFGAYEVPVKYLAKIDDFLKVWQNHWSYFLLPYHPEFHYYIYCKEESGSFAFDYKLMSLEDVPVEGAEEYVKTNDPFIKNINALIPGIKKNFATLLKTELVTKYPLLDPNANGGLENYIGNTMCQLQNQKDKCTVKTCSNKISSRTDWAIFKSLYTSEKQKLVRVLATMHAMENKSYNGCIGNPDFYYTQDATLFRIPEKTVIKVKSTVCDWGLCFEGLTYENETVYSYPLFQPEQTCYNGVYKLYEDKNAHFFPSLPPSWGADELASTLTPIDPTNTNPDYLSDLANYTSTYPASEALDFTHQNLENKYRNKFETCGICPLPSEIEDFLADLTQMRTATSKTPSEKLKSNIPLVCPFTAENITLGDAFTSQLLGNPPADKKLSWIGDNTINTNKSITGYFKEVNVYEAGNNPTTAPTIATLKLEIPSQYPLTTFDNLAGICCLNTDPVHSNLFTVKARFGTPTTVASTNYSTVTYSEVLLNGSLTMQDGSSVNLNTCNITPLCSVSDDAKKITKFLGNLVAKTNVAGAANKVNQLKAQNINLLDGNIGSSNTGYYINSLQSLAGLDETTISSTALTQQEFLSNYSATWSWNATTSSGTLTLTKNGTTNIKTWTISFPEFTGSLESIQQVSSLKPISPITCTDICPNDEFGAVVLSQNSTGLYSNLPIKIKVEGQAMTVCRQAKAPTK